MRDTEYMGTVRHIREHGALHPVLVVAVEQRLGAHRGQWVCIRESTGRRIHRTTRQLHPAHVRFTADDPAGLWKSWDIATDLGWESDHPDAPPIRLLRLHRTDEVLSLTDPEGRGLIERVM